MAWQPQELLLQDTILVLKQRQGASLAQIRKRLELNNSDGGKLDEAKNKMLSSTLKNLVLKGTVEKNGGIYKLARGTLADQENEVLSRRRRAFPHGPSKSHQRYRKLRRRRRSHRHRGRRHRSHHRRHSRQRRAFPHGRYKRLRRYHKLRRGKGHRHCS